MQLCLVDRLSHPPLTKGESQKGRGRGRGRRRLRWSWRGKRLCRQCLLYREDEVEQGGGGDIFHALSASAGAEADEGAGAEHLTRLGVVRSCHCLSILHLGVETLIVPPWNLMCVSWNPLPLWTLRLLLDLLVVCVFVQLRPVLLFLCFCRTCARCRLLEDCLILSTTSAPHTSRLRRVSSRSRQSARSLHRECCLRMRCRCSRTWRLRLSAQSRRRRWRLIHAPR